MDELVKPKRKRGQVYEDETDSPRAGQLGRAARAGLRFGWRVIKAPFVWTWRGTKRVLGWTWRKTQRLLSWMWHTATALLTWSFFAPFRAARWLFYLIFGRPEPPPQNHFEEIRQIIRRRYQRRRRFVTHLFIYGSVNGGLWLNLLTMHSNWYYPSVREYVVFTAFWSVFLLFHFVRIRMGSAEDLALEAAAEREREWQQSGLEAERHLRLSDDGELIDYQPAQHKLKR